MLDEENWYQDFQGGQVERHLNHTLKLQSWKVKSGSFQCQDTDCNRVFNVGEYLLPVFYKNYYPTNFVCSSCRGLLKLVT
jgi:hypothetical protein